MLTARRSGRFRSEQCETVCLMAILIVRSMSSCSKFVIVFTTCKSNNRICRYSCDSRSVGLFHYLLSGDDRLMRQAIDNFAASATPEGLTQSRFPSHVRQIIASFSLY